MKNMKTYTQIKLVTLLFIVILALPSFAGATNNSAAAYIRMGIGGRIIAMGEAGSAATNDVSAAYWNPAGLTGLKDIEFFTMQSLNMGFDRVYQNAALAKRFDFGVLAINWINAGVSDIDGTDSAGNYTGSFDEMSHNIAISYANKFNRLSYGITPKLYISTMDGESKTGFGIDLGAKYDINQYVEAGLTIRDAYGEISRDSKDRVPFQIQTGVAVYPLLGVTIAADVQWEQHENPQLVFGAEYWTSVGRDPEADSKLSVINVHERSTWADILSHFQTGLRVGYNQDRFSAGAGIRFRNFQIDYAYRLGNHDFLNDEHLLSLILRF